MSQEKDTVLVIKPIHDATKRAYDYKPVEVPSHVAQEQLTKDDGLRNYHWRGVRFATDDEHNKYYKILPKATVKPEKVQESIEELVEEITTEGPKSKPGRKPNQK